MSRFSFYIPIQRFLESVKFRPEAPERDRGKRPNLKAYLATIALLAMITAPAVLPHVSAQSTSFSFNLITPNVSKALTMITFMGVTIAKDSTVRLTGSGTFDTLTRDVSGGGSTIGLSPTGTVDARGTWTVTDFVSFNPYAGPMGNAGQQGGLLVVKASFTITFTVSGATMTFTGVPVQVSCRLNAPAVAPDEGTTIPRIFDKAIDGSTLFHENS